MNVYILAGGKSSRLNNICKAFLKIKEKYLIDILIEKLDPQFKNVYIVTKEIYKKRYSGYKNVIGEKTDIYSSLSGIFTALSHTKERWNFIIGVDMPGVKPELIKKMTEYRKGVEIIVPIVRGYPEPLFAFYNKSILNYIKKLIEKKEFKIQNLYKNAKVAYIEEEIVRKYDPFLESFININTWEDYKKARKLL